MARVHEPNLILGQFGLGGAGPRRVALFSWCLLQLLGGHFEIGLQRFLATGLLSLFFVGFIWPGFRFLPRALLLLEMFLGCLLGFLLKLLSVPFGGLLYLRLVRRKLKFFELLLPEAVLEGLLLADCA